MLIQLLKFFSSSLGTNYYSFGIQLTLFIAVLFYSYIAIKEHKLPSANVFFSLLIVYLLQLLQGVGSALPFREQFTSSTFLPALDRAIILLQLLWVYLALNQVVLRDIKIYLIVGFHAFVAVLFIQLSSLPLGEGGVGNFNFTDQAFYWSLAFILFSVVAVLSSTKKKNPFTVLNMAFFGIVCVGSFTDLLFVPFWGDYSGFMRVSLIIGFPLLMLLPHLVLSAENQIDEKVVRDFIQRIEQNTDSFFAQTASFSPVHEIEAEPEIASVWTADHASLLNEVKQPLSSILGYTDLLGREENGELGALQKKYIDRIRSAAGSIEHKIDEINHLREIEQGGIKFIPELIDLDGVLFKAIQRSEFLIKEKEISAETKIEVSEKKLIGDRNSLQTMLNIAIENAVTASRQAGTVVILAQEDPAIGGHIMLSVSDSGDGILESEMEHLFDKRISASDPLIKGIGDKGVGLSILRALVEAQHGTIKVESKPASGTTFIISLPMNIVGSFQPVSQNENN